MCIVPASMASFLVGRLSGAGADAVTNFDFHHRSRDVSAVDLSRRIVLYTFFDFITHHLNWKTVTVGKVEVAILTSRRERPLKIAALSGASAAKKPPLLIPGPWMLRASVATSQCSTPISGILICKVKINLWSGSLSIGIGLCIGPTVQLYGSNSLGLLSSSFCFALKQSFPDSTSFKSVRSFHCSLVIRKPSWSSSSLSPDCRLLPPYYPQGKCSKNSM
jgi:hypothetical protein